jgi:hypothetical protein
MSPIHDIKKAVDDTVQSLQKTLSLQHDAIEHAKRQRQTANQEPTESQDH